jgi:hypothetical protein
VFSLIHLLLFLTILVLFSLSLLILVHLCPKTLILSFVYFYSVVLFLTVTIAYTGRRHLNITFTRRFPPTAYGII